MEACSNSGPTTDPSSAGMSKALLIISSGKFIFGRYEVGLDDTGVDGLVK
jgi:hypothetical protein